MGAALHVRGLRVSYPRGAKWSDAVDGVDLALESGQVHALVGESGCGKSSLALALLGLVRAPGRLSAGTLSFDERSFDLRDSRAHVEVRGRVVGLLLQESALALDPRLSVERQLLEALRVARPSASPSELRAEALTLLERVGFEAPLELLARFPHELSGGMRQRVQLAAALAPRPRYLVADEPTASLDALLARRIVELLRGLAEREGLGVLLVTHDLAAAGELAARISVMYAGRVVESGPAREVLLAPRHPYTQALVAASPAREPLEAPMEPLAGRAPEPGERPVGCAFAPRCGSALERCALESPQLAPEGVDRQLACPPRAQGTFR